MDIATLTKHADFHFMHMAFSEARLSTMGKLAQLRSIEFGGEGLKEFANVQILVW